MLTNQDVLSLVSGWLGEFDVD